MLLLWQWRIQKILVGGDFKHKTAKIRMSSPKLRVVFWPKLEIQTIFSPKIRCSPKKKKKVFTKIESDFLAGFVTFRLVGGDASRNGAELFEIEADFSAKIVTFRLVGDAYPPLNPPLYCGMALTFCQLWLSTNAQINSQSDAQVKTSTYRNWRFKITSKSRVNLNIINKILI